MTESQIAKKLLEGKNCRACRYAFHAMGDWICQDEESALHYFPEEFTCEKWERPRPLSVTWTTTPTINPIVSKAAERRLIRRVTREIRKSLKR